jgi:hemoglobin
MSATWAMHRPNQHPPTPSSAGKVAPGTHPERAGPFSWWDAAAILGGMTDDTVYAAAGGTEGLLRLAHAWHARCLADPVVSHAFEGGFRDDHSERLAAYWSEALGGPSAYTSAYGDESTVVRMHSGNGVHDEMDRRAIACFAVALADVGLSAETGPGRVLHDYFAWATTTTMTAYHRSPDDVPDGLELPRWSWDGLQT